MVIEAAGMYSYIPSGFTITKRLGQVSVTRTLSSSLGVVSLCAFLLIVFVLCVLLPSYVYLLYYVCIAIIL